MLRTHIVTCKILTYVSHWLEQKRSSSRRWLNASRSCTIHEQTPFDKFDWHNSHRCLSIDALDERIGWASFFLDGTVRNGDDELFSWSSRNEIVAADFSRSIVSDSGLIVGDRRRELTDEVETGDNTDDWADIDGDGMLLLDLIGQE